MGKAAASPRLPLLLPLALGLQWRWRKRKLSLSSSPAPASSAHPVVAPAKERGKPTLYTLTPPRPPWISEAARLAPGSATPSTPSFAHLTNPRSPKDSLSDSFFLLLLLLLSLLLFLLLLLLLLTSSPALRAYVPLLLAPFASVSLPDPRPALSHIGVIFQWEIYATLRCALYTLPPRRLPPR